MDGNVVDVDLALLNEMEQEIEGPFKVLDANLIGQFGLFDGVEVVVHRSTYTRLGGGRASLHLLVVVGGIEAVPSSQSNQIGNQQGAEHQKGKDDRILYCLIFKPQGCLYGR